MSDNDGISIDGEPSRKVRVYQMRGSEAVKVVAEYEDEDDLLKRHRPNLGRLEAVLVLEKDRTHFYVPIRKYLKELKARAARGNFAWLDQLPMSKDKP